MGDKKGDKDQKQSKKDERSSWFNNDYDLFDWSGKQVDKGADVRRKGSDR